jgi:hypothetical protein
MGASLEATRVAIEGTRVKALNVIGSTVAISDCVIRDTSGRGSDHIMGYGIAASTSTVDVSRCLVERSTEAGLVYQQSTGTLEDIVVRGTRCQEETGEWGRGINVQTESSVTLHRALLHENRDVGIVVGATATLADVMVISTLPRVSDDTFGQGINVSAGGDMTAERLLLAGNMNAGLVLTEGTAAVTDLEVRDTLPSDSDGLQGFGIGIEARSSLDLTRAHVHHNGEIGIVIENSDATLSHVLVTDTLPRLVTEEWGRGLLVQRASHVQVSSAVFTRNRELSVGAFGEGALVEMQDVSVTDTLLRACAETTCPDDGAGMGVGAYGGAHIAMSGFFVLDSATCGLQMAMGQLPDGTMMTEYGTIELHDGEVSNNPIGVNVHDPTFDVELLMDNVSYHHNDQNLDSTFLPVPDMGEVPEL